MKLKFLAAPFYKQYTISGETVNGIDLSGIERGGHLDLTPVDDTTPEAITAGIYGAHRDNAGELFVTLTQQTVGPNHWRESDWIDANDYDPNQCYCTLLGMDGMDYEVKWERRIIHRKPDGTEIGEEGFRVVNSRVRGKPENLPGRR